jgi:YggT family protein
MGPLIQAIVGGIALVLWLLVFGRIMISWFDPMGRTPVAGFLIQMTEPILAPIRRLLPQTGMFDFSSLIVLIVLGFVMRTLL